MKLQRSGAQYFWCALPNIILANITTRERCFGQGITMVELEHLHSEKHFYIKMKLPALVCCNRTTRMRAALRAANAPINYSSGISNTEPAFAFAFTEFCDGSEISCYGFDIPCTDTEISFHGSESATAHRSTVNVK